MSFEGLNHKTEVKVTSYHDGTIVIEDPINKHYKKIIETQDRLVAKQLKNLGWISPKNALRAKTILHDILTKAKVDLVKIENLLEDMK